MKTALIALALSVSATGVFAGAHAMAPSVEAADQSVYAPLRKGDNMDVAAILQEEVKPGDMLMLMVHGETGGMKTGVFEYTLGAKEDGPIKVDDKLVMQVITAK